MLSKTLETEFPSWNAGYWMEFSCDCFGYWTFPNVLWTLSGHVHEVLPGALERCLLFPCHHVHWKFSLLPSSPSQKGSD